MKLKHWLWWVPLLIFIWVCWLFGTILLKAKEGVTTPIEKPLPTFSLPVLGNPQEFYSEKEMRGKIVLVNFWATWCPPCREEHPSLVQISKKYDVKKYNVEMVGINYKDKPDAAAKWLVELGNPYTITLEDAQGRAGIEWGVIGIPETFLVDAQGIVRYKHTGPVTMATWENEIWPLICTWLNKDSNKGYIQCLGA